MADNYLEKKFEEYAAAKAGRRAPHRLSPAGNRQGVVEFKFPRRRVVVAVETTPRRPSLPTAMGLPRNSGLSRCSTAAKNASMSICIIFRNF